jgi:hypothetical protein
MNNSDLDQIIKDYLTAPNTDYAVMISGEWGSGKSYYITHGLNSFLKSIALPGIVGESKNNWFRKREIAYYSPAYISLYGVSSVIDFEVRVFNGINSWTNHNFIRVAGLLGSKAGEYFGISSWEKDAKTVTFIRRNRVLIFDDLERICEDKIAIKEVLGLINSYAEHSHFKVIIVCNENHYLSDDVDDGVKKDYQKYKEKSVRFTYKFTPDVEAVYNAMVNEVVEEDYKRYLNKEKNSILSLFGLGGEKNLRTLKFIIDSFCKIYQIVQLAEYKVKTTRTYLVTFMLYACEYKRGHHAQELDSLDSRGHQISLGTYIGALKNEINKDENKKKDYGTEFKERYHDVYSEFRPCHLLIEYIGTGFLHEGKFKKEISRLDKELSKLEVTKEGEVYQKLLRMSEMNDEDIIPLMEEMIGFVKEDKYNLYDLLNIYALLLKYDYWEAGGFKLTDEMDYEFKASMQRQKNEHKYNNFFEVQTPIFENSAQSRPQYQRFKALKELAMEINWQAKNRDEIEDGTTFLSIAERGDVEKLRDYRVDQNKLISLIGIDWKRIIELIKTAPNPIACEVCECVMAFISNPGAVKPDDRDRIKEELIPALDRYLKEEKPQIRKMYVTELKNLAEEVVK